MSNLSINTACGKKIISSYETPDGETYTIAFEEAAKAPQILRAWANDPEIAFSYQDAMIFAAQIRLAIPKLNAA